MGDVGPAGRPRMHLAAWWLPVTTLVVLAAALVFIALNTSRTSTAKVGLDAILAAGVLMYAASGPFHVAWLPVVAIIVVRLLVGGRGRRRYDRGAPDGAGGSSSRGR